MKALAWILWTLSSALGVIAFAAFLAACWAHGDNAGRWVGTGFVLAVAALAAGGFGFAASEAR